MIYCRCLLNFDCLRKYYLKIGEKVKFYCDSQFNKACFMIIKENDDLAKQAMEQLIKRYLNILNRDGAEVKSYRVIKEFCEEHRLDEYPQSIRNELIAEEYDISQDGKFVMLQTLIEIKASIEMGWSHLVANAVRTLAREEEDNSL